MPHRILNGFAFPGLRSRHRSDSGKEPQELLETMHLFEGALYGLSPIVTPGELFPHTKPIADLFLAGQTTFSGYGVGAAMMSGIFAA